MSEAAAGQHMHDSSKRTVEVELLGRRFKVRSDDDDTYIRELVDYVNRRLGDMRRTSNLIESEQIALLTLLEVTDALFREKRRSDALRRKVREGSRKLLGVIDRLADTLGNGAVREEAEALADVAAIAPPSSGS